MPPGLAVSSLNALAASINRSIRWRVRDAVTGFSVQIALSASNTCSVVISWSFLSCRLGTSRMERCHCFNSSSDSPWHRYQDTAPRQTP